MYNVSLGLGDNSPNAVEREDDPNREPSLEMKSNDVENGDDSSLGTHENSKYYDTQEHDKWN